MLACSRALQRLCQHAGLASSTDSGDRSRCHGFFFDGTFGVVDR